MNKRKVLDEILMVLNHIKDDSKKLEKLHNYIFEEIYEVNNEEVEEIPEKYYKVISSAAESIDAGLIVFINPKTLEFEDFPKEFYMDEFEYLSDSEQSEFELKHLKWKEYIEIPPLESYESFKIMELFANKLPEGDFKEQVLYKLNRKRPFANFKQLVENSKYRTKWFEFKKKYLEKHIFELLSIELEI